ncbi:MAG TPA: hypothetical protein VMB27_14200 [Solirubrobacteraceae bacterium]|nr:hypothetical protein [Solirubrobacteraceae bacterium]
MLTHPGPADLTPSEPHSGLVWFAEECMNNGAPLERYIVHAESIGDRELATFFRRALAECRRVRPGDRRRWNRRARDRRR